MHKSPEHKHKSNYFFILLFYYFCWVENGFLFVFLNSCEFTEVIYVCNANLQVFARGVETNNSWNFRRPRCLKLTLTVTAAQLLQMTV